MATDAVVTLPSGVWTQLGAEDAVNCSVMHHSGRDVLIRGAVGAVAPDIIQHGLRLRSGIGAAQSNLRNITVASLGLVGTATRVYGRPDGVGEARVYFADDADPVGAAAMSEAVDAMAFVGDVIVGGTMAATEAPDDVDILGDA